MGAPGTVTTPGTGATGDGELITVVYDTVDVRVKGLLYTPLAEVYVAYVTGQVVVVRTVVKVAMTVVTGAALGVRPFGPGTTTGGGPTVANIVVVGHVVIVV